METSSPSSSSWRMPSSGNCSNCSNVRSVFDAITSDSSSLFLADTQQFHIVQHADQSRHERDHEQDRQDEDDNGEQHLNTGFPDGGFGPQAAAGAQGIGVDFQRLRQAGAEALAL